jgi:hypothetical protein
MPDQPSPPTDPEFDHLPPGIREHIEQVRQWLEENVEVYPTPDRVTLSEFKVDWAELEGSFQVSLDDTRLTDRFRFGVAQLGKPSVYLPMFHSPLGAPVSYATVELTDETSKAILQGLYCAIPPVEACGVDPRTGKQIWNGMPIRDRIIDRDSFERMKKQTESEGYSVTVQISGSP